ncbi:MAG: hypothetical protein R2856_17115 [Caldilineaceae bacterium]
MMLLGSFARDLGNDALAYILTGNIVLALLFEHQGKLTSHFSFMRMAGALDYFATLPVQKMVLILAAWAAFFILFIPVLLTTLVGGMLILRGSTCTRWHSSSCRSVRYRWRASAR